MPKSFLSYWRPDTAEDALLASDELFTHAASGQYGRLSAGDTLWIVTAWYGGVLTLIGRLVVDQIVDQQTAAQLLDTTDLWEAKYHVIGSASRAEPMREVDISDIAGQLRFQSAQDRLVVVDGRVRANQLQTMRELTDDSARLLETRWSDEYVVEQAIGEVTAEAHSRAGFGDPATNKIVEAFAVKHVRDTLTAEGWMIESVEQLKIGYDLRCRRGDEELHVEVKGVRSPQLAIIVTEGERRRAESDPMFTVYVVTRALSDQAELYRFTGEDFLEWAYLAPLAYRAVIVQPSDD
jgi:hypothetical protein